MRKTLLGRFCCCLFFLSVFASLRMFVFDLAALSLYCTHICYSLDSLVIYTDNWSHTFDSSSLPRCCCSLLFATAEIKCRFLLHSKLKFCAPEKCEFSNEERWIVCVRLTHTDLDRFISLFFWLRTMSENNDKSKRNEYIDVTVTYLGVCVCSRSHTMQAHTIVSLRHTSLICALRVFFSHSKSLQVLAWDHIYCFIAALGYYDSVLKFIARSRTPQQSIRHTDKQNESKKRVGKSENEQSEFLFHFVLLFFVLRSIEPCVKSIHADRLKLYYSRGAGILSVILFSCDAFCDHLVITFSLPREWKSIEKKVERSAVSHHHLHHNFESNNCCERCFIRAFHRKWS